MRGVSKWEAINLANNFMRKINATEKLTENNVLLKSGSIKEGSRIVYLVFLFELNDIVA